ncbi:hypothetical protein [Oceanobacillus oncorhynchi]|uniref:hypothetical protein n=1 Tax=Oceanobacillus oncorhynchi TaxID=545501 RepID=UPI0025A3CE06|nr:hypothetical protein [Oceanobacillus oncorhynchi]MDM8100957.1 hypothetical protein [Oceanobacillus oncorhynchi]
MDIEQIAVDVRNTVQDIPKIYKANNERLSKLQGEITDLTHLIELVDLNAVEGFKVYKQLQGVLQERRKLKDENELLKHLGPVFSDWGNKIGSLNSAIGDIRNQKKSLGARLYQCRVRKDLENQINGIKEAKDD